jgi:4-hydroxy-tetrahydrodipicolinate synthase
MLPMGVLTAVLTPLREDFGIDHPAFAEHCRWLLANGCDGVAPMGTTGEANSFSVGERFEALERLLAAGIPRDRMVIGTGCSAVPDTVALTRHALDNGVVDTLMLPPFYYKNVGDDGVYAAFDQVIQRIGDKRLKIYLYHFPQMSGVPITHTLIEKLLKKYPDTVVGVKDSSGDWDNMKIMCERYPGFRVYAGTEKVLLAILRAGGAGCISATTNVTCRLAGELFAKWKTAEADTLQERLTAVRNVMEKYPRIAVLKQLAAERTGRPSLRIPRPPLEPLSAAHTKQILAELADVGFTQS